MLFSTLVFLFAFLPAILLAYYLIKPDLRNILLLVGSLCFYAWGGVSYTLVLVLSIVINFYFAKRIVNSIANKRHWLRLGITFNVVTLIVFKYLDFIIENLNLTSEWLINSSMSLPLANIVLPLGISFFTFQEMSMLWDLYREKQKQTSSFINMALYVSFFPQLVAGPIVRYNDIIDQIKGRKESISDIYIGIKRFCLGLFKKVIIANTCGALADEIISLNAMDLSTPAAWLGIAAYSFQIYFDFSGYSDMAIGLSRMFGFRILENFNFPYISQSIKEFWRRWHISLSVWFRDYVYIPLGGNRIGPYRTYVNLLIVFLLTGFWHGATWSFVFWGVFHGLFLIIERLGFDKVLARIPAAFRWVYTMAVVMIGWVFFRIEEFSDAFTYVTILLGGSTDDSMSYYEFLNRENVLILLLAALSSTTFFKLVNERIEKMSGATMPSLVIVFQDLIYLLMFLVSVLYINAGSYSPFIYFRF